MYLWYDPRHNSHVVTDMMRKLIVALAAYYAIGMLTAFYDVNMHRERLNTIVGICQPKDENELRSSVGLVVVSWPFYWMVELPMLSVRTCS